MSYAHPLIKSAYIAGHSDGERGLPSRARQYSRDQRASYERGYGKGFDARYRSEYERIYHGNCKRVTS